MAINKVEFGDEVLIDLTEDTVTEDTLLEGETAHDASGNPIRGRAKIDTTEVSTTDLSNSAEGNIRSLHLYGKGQKIGSDLITSSGVVESQSKNNIVYPHSNTTKTTNGITFTDNKDGSVTINGTATATAWYDFSSNKTSVALDETYTSMHGVYTLSGGANNVNLFIRFDTESTNGTQFNAFDGVATTFTVPESGWDRVALQMYIPSGRTFNNVTVRPMLEKGSIATDFVPYSTSTINASEILNSTFTGVNDIKDELIVNADGSGKFIKRVGSIIFDGTSDEGWEKSQGSVSGEYRNFTNAYQSLIKKPTNDSIQGNLISTKYDSKKAIDTYNMQNGISVNSNGTIYVVDDSYKDNVLGTWQKYLESNPITLIYELATPTETTLTPSQVAQLLSLKSFRDTTLITSDCDYEIGYFKNNETGQSVADVDVKVNNVASVVADNKDWLKGKNLLNSTLQTTTFNGVTCTNNGDGTYTLNGTATANATFTMFNGETTGTYRLVGCPSGGSTSLYAIGVQIDEQWVGNKYDVGNGSTFSIENKLGIVLFVAKDKTVNNLLFKPMLVDADLYPNVTYDDFVPYTKSNVELTSDVAKLTPNLITGWTYNTDKITYIGSTNVIQIGKIVIVTFNIGIGTALSNNDIILSGLPKAKYRSLGVLVNARNKNIVATIKPNETVIKVDIASDATSFTEGQLVYITE